MGESKALSANDLAGVNQAAAMAAPFEEFCELERDRLCDLLALVTGDRSEAAEIAQDAFVAIWERWDRVQLMDNPVGYLHRTAMNASESGIDGRSCSIGSRPPYRRGRARRRRIRR